MLNLILAAEEAVSGAPAGESWATFAYALLGIVLLITAVATVIVTPKAESHH